MNAFHFESHLSRILFGDMVPNIDQDYILLLGYSASYKEYNLTRFNHKKNYSCVGAAGTLRVDIPERGWQRNAV